MNRRTKHFLGLGGMGVVLLLTVWLEKDREPVAVADSPILKPVIKVVIEDEDDAFLAVAELQGPSSSDAETSKEEDVFPFPFTRGEDGESWTAVNPLRGLRASVGPGSLAVEAAGGHSLGLELTGIGYGVAETLPDVLGQEDAGSLVTFNREGGIAEWYKNDGIHGVEQGFTLTEQPQGASAGGPLLIAMEIESGGLEAELSGDGRAMHLCEDDGQEVLRYHGLIAYDASGKSLPASMELAENRLTLAVSDAEALYPIVVDPWVDVPQESTFAEGEATQSLALDGNRMIVGIPNANGEQGKALVFDVNTGEELFELLADDRAAGDLFGTSVAISGDLAVVGAPKDSSGSELKWHGSAYLFQLTDGSQIRKLVADDISLEQAFGSSVAIDGGAIVIGAPGDGTYFIEELKTFEGWAFGSYTYTKLVDTKKNGPGAAYVFGGGNSSQLYKLTAPRGQEDDKFGARVAVEGGIALIGAPHDRLKEDKQGSVHVYDIDTGDHLHHLHGIDRSSTYFGTSIGLSGNTGIVGGRFAGAYLFDLVTGLETKRLGTNLHQLGSRVAISGEVAILGDPYENFNVYGNFRFLGAAYLYDVVGGGLLRTLEASDPEDGDYFGAAVCLSGDLAAVGRRIGGEFAVYLYDVRDGDGDALLDYVEREIGADPTLVDTDSDGLNDGDEVFVHHTSPVMEDTDGDLLLDLAELEDHKTNPTVADSDADGLDDGDEVLNVLTDPRVADTDGDGIADGAEVNVYSSDPLIADTDGDGLDDGLEVLEYFTNLRIPDSDLDGFTDGDEVILSSDPLANSSIPTVDFGDAPSSYPVSLANRGAIHGPSDLVLGNSVDSEPDAFVSSDAQGDDDSEASDDEDGVVMLDEPWIKGELAKMQVQVTGGNGFLQVWLDVNADGDWDDVGEQVATDHAVSAETNVVSFVVPVEAQATSALFVRVRLSSVQGLGLRGAAADGEVEDHTVSITINDEFRLAHSSDAEDHFGSNIALGETYALLGLPMDDVDFNEEAGSVGVYERATGNFVTSLTAPDGMAGDHFGHSVAVCESRAYVGAPGHQGTGAVYVFALPGGALTEQIESPSGTPEGNFGAAVACDRSALVVGASGSVVDAGNAYVYHRSGSPLLYTLTSPESVGAQYYGHQIGVAWPYVVVSAPWESEMSGHSAQGAVYVWEIDPMGSVELRHRLEASDGVTGDYFGLSLDVDGNYMVVGSSPKTGPSGSNQGAAYVYEIVSGEEIHRLSATDAAAGMEFGSSVSIDGAFALIGAPGATVSGTLNQGKGYVYDLRDGSLASQVASSEGAAGDLFGHAAALRDGVALVGSYGADTGAGAVDLFSNFLPGVVYHDLTVASAPFDGGTAYAGSPFNLGLPVSVPEGLKAFIEAQPMTEFAFGVWSGTGIEGPTNSRATVLMDGAKTVTANFESGWSISVGFGIGGHVLVDGLPSEELPFGTRYADGRLIPIEAIPDEDYFFAGWIGDGIADPGASATRVLMVQDQFVEAVFQEKPTWELELEVDPLGPEFLVLGADGGPFRDGTLAPIDAETTNPDYLFFRWVGDGVTDPNSSQTTVLMDQARSLVAEFSLQVPWELRLESIEPNPPGTLTGAGVYLDGTTATISATPDPGYLFTEWLSFGGFGLPADPMASTTTILMDAEYTLEPTFELNAGPGYVMWVDQFLFGPEGSRSPVEDSDGDLTNTFGEYAGGLSPILSSQFFALEPDMVTVAGEYFLEGAVTLRTGDDDLSFAVEHSSDNATWQSQALSYDGIGWTLEAGQVVIPEGGATLSDLGPEIHRLVFRDTQAVAIDSNGFLRVRVSDSRGNESIATPIGYHGIACLSGSDTAISLSFQKLPLFRGVASSGGAELVPVRFDDPLAEMTPGEFAGAFLKGVGGEADGYLYHILDNNLTELTIAISEGEQTAITEGQRFEILPYWTLGEVFDPAVNPAIHDSAGDSVFGRRTQLLASNRVSYGTNLNAGGIYYRPEGGPWKVAFDHDPETEPGDSADDLILWPEAYFTVRHRSSDGTTLFLDYGSVPPVGLRVPVVTLEDQSQDNPLGTGNASEQSLASLQLWESGTLVGSEGTSIFARKDTLLVYDNDSAAQLKTASAIYYFDLLTLEWRDAKSNNDVVDPALVVFPPGSVLILRAAASDGFTRFWNRPNN